MNQPLPAKCSPSPPQEERARERRPSHKLAGKPNPDDYPAGLNPETLRIIENKLNLL